ncbi:MAG: DUF4388 domain-containing protein [bacterium]|uniref:PatA-like N-terminal domain-containing protein n=2 Tax=Bacteria candidate phyla TaxID=1783234 RepID=A0A101I3M5_UNCT6|nr:MAG: hypothetical protein XD76_1026 [candidate division TA06 bacterium 32_111]KUK87300.1 MAG: hypothetical protein XE03_0908 [candidate division TA06 bacterium 34_109]MDI6700442.1 DUF4388 domain-containing protein [bacterium]HAF07566.1 hypothetical protein [candidate division WOR-3 bacterium]HCP16815.1 hypothetical protein [candidate division WOR-3 bacterium]
MDKEKVDLKANLEIFSAVEFINLISSKQRTGVLIFNVEDKEGKIFFDKGLPKHAVYNSFTGEEALYNLSIERNGSITYLDGEKTEEITIEQKNTSSLIEQIEKRRMEFDDILKRLPSFDAVLEKRAEGLGDNISLRKTDWVIIRIVDGKKNIKTVIKESKLPLIESYKSLEYLISKGLIFDKSFVEKLRKDFEKSLNNILDTFSVKNTNDKEWFNFIVDLLTNSGFEIIAGFLKFKNGMIEIDDNADRFIDEAKVQNMKRILFEKIMEKGIEEYGGMIAKKKYRELLNKEGVSDGTF